MRFAFTLFRGDTAAKKFIIRSAIGDRAVVDLTGMTLTIAADPDGAQTGEANQIFKKTMTITDAVNGLVEFSLEVADWVGVAAGDYFFDIQAVDGASEIQTLVKGRFRIVQDINKS